MTEPVRILQIVSYMDRGGLETMLMNYYRQMDKEQIQFDFLVHRDFKADYDDEILALGGKIYHLPVLNPFSRKYIKALDNFFSEHREYNVVHCHLDCAAGIPLKYARKNGIPVRIAHAHSNNQQKNIYMPVKLFFKRNICHYATNLYACSDEAGEWMFNGSPFEVMTNAINCKEYIFNDGIRQEMRRELCISDNQLVIGMVARFTPEKNHEFAIDIFKEIHSKNKGAVLLLIGSGPLADKMKNKVNEYGLQENVRFLGVRSDIPLLMQAMDVSILPSIFEGLGIVNIEAQSAGLPCIVSDRVSPECKVTSDLVTMLPLEAGAEIWADTILNAKLETRRDTYEEVKNAKFDIVENAKKLQSTYLRFSETGK